MLVLQAKVRELEDGMGPSTSTTYPMDSYDDQPLAQVVGAHPQQSASSHTTGELEGTHLSVAQQWNWDLGLDNLLDKSSSSPSSSHSEASTSCDNSLPIFDPYLGDSSVFDDLIGLVRNPPEPRISEPDTTLTMEMHNALVASFLTHRKQCCFYANSSRFDPSSPADVYQQTQPNPALMSAIYLLGSFFACGPLPASLEPQLLEQTLQDISRSLHCQEQLMDVAQALALLAQYFFFNNRGMEGNRHLLAAKRLSQDLQLHQSLHPDLSIHPFDFDLGSSFDSLGDWKEQCAIFWQIFTVDQMWSATSNYSAVSSSFESPHRKVTTPLPILESANSSSAIGNSPIHALFELDDFHVVFLSPPAFKSMAACIFDRSIRLHNTPAHDSSTWVFHRSAAVALQRLSSLIPPFVVRELNFAEKPYFDTDLFTAHTLILVSTIHLHCDSILKISWAANQLMELLKHLQDSDYPLLDPILAVCWSTALDVFLRITKGTSNASISGATPSYTAAFPRQCTEMLTLALHNMSGSSPLADNLLQLLVLEDHSPLSCQGGKAHVYLHPSLSSNGAVAGPH